MAAWPTRIFPFLGWVGSYRRADARQDAIAGLTTAVLLVPQAMAYAMLAGLPPIVGLYASTAPIIVYALLGTSRQLAVGPVAIDSLLVATALTPLAVSGSSEYLAYAVALALLVGIIQVAMGLLRAGFLVNFLSQPVVSGFTSAAALVIGFSQLKHLLGLEIAGSSQIHTIAFEAIRRASEIKRATVFVGLGSVLALVLLSRYAPRWPRALIVVAGSILLVWGLGLSTQVAIVGHVPAGLPIPALPRIDTALVSTLAPSAAIIALVAFMESISVAKSFASKNRYTINANQELIGLGLANLAASVVRGYPVTGGFSRTAVNAQAGARSGVAGLVTAGIVILTLLLLTDLFYFLPNAALAAVIMTAVFGLVNVAEARRLWTVDRADFALLALTFVGTLVLGIQVGIGLGVGASILWFIVRTTRPHTAVLGRLPGTTVYRNVERYPQAQRVDRLLLLRIDASFYFGNVTFLKDTMTRRLTEDPTLAAIVLDAASINRLDSSADTAVGELDVQLRERGITLHLAGVKGPVRDMMQRSGLAEQLGPRAKHRNVHEAVAAAKADITMAPEA